MEVAFPINNIKYLASLCQVSFEHISRSTNGLADALAKQKVDRLINFTAHIL